MLKRQRESACRNYHPLHVVNLLSLGCIFPKVLNIYVCCGPTLEQARFSPRADLIVGSSVWKSEWSGSDGQGYSPLEWID
jgi:hypothetical protein